MISGEEFTVGETPPFTVFFLDSNQDRYVPDDVDLTVRAPDGSLTTPAVTGPSADLEFSGTETVDAAGIWRWRWVGSGPGGLVVVDEGSFCVRESVVMV